MKRRALLTLCVSAVCLAAGSAADTPKKEDPIVGRWRQPQKPRSQGDKVIVFKADGSCYSYHPKEPRVNGKWSVANDGDLTRKYKVVWAGGASETEYHLGAQDDKLRHAKTNKIAYERYVE